MSYIPRIAKAYMEEQLSQEELAYYARHLLLPGIGTRGQLKLKCARVLVVGAGGLGCPVLQALAGAGVGNMTVIDGDEVSLSNLSRQWLHRYGDVGVNKAQSASLAVSELNPFTQIKALDQMLDEENAASIIDAYDLVVDATDDLEVRYLIDAVCANQNKPWVHAALYRERSQLCVFWEQCDARFEKLFPEKSEAPSCAGAGMLGASASVIANLQALEVIKLITGSAQPKVGELVSFDAAGMVLQSFKLPGVKSCDRIEDQDKSSLGMTTDALNQALSIHEPIVLIDIRSAADYEDGTLTGAVHCSAETILERGLPEEISAEGRLVLLCEEGLVSALLADALKARGLDKVSFLEGGINGSEL